MAEIAIVGGGLMGHGIALVLALHGHAVRITDTDAQTRAGVPKLMESALATLQEGNAAPDSWDAARLAQAVRVEADLAPAVAGAGLVIEAITENPEAKRVLFAELDRLCPAHTILASNTSYLDVFPLIPQARQARALVMHWYTPPYIVDLVDVVPGPGTDPAVIAAMRDLVLGLGQVPIDDAVIHGLSLRIPILGHLAKADFTGLDLTRRALANGSYTPPQARTRSETLDALCAEGRTGVMAGRGYFDWGGREPAELFHERDRKLLALKRAMAGIGRMEGT